MNTTKAEQIVDDWWLNYTDEYSFITARDKASLKKLVDTALIQYATEQNKELVKLAQEVNDHLYDKQDISRIRDIAAAIFAQHSEKGEK